MAPTTVRGPEAGALAPRIGIGGAGRGATGSKPAAGRAAIGGEGAGLSVLGFAAGGFGVSMPGIGRVS